MAGHDSCSDERLAFHDSTVPDTWTRERQDTQHLDEPPCTHLASQPQRLVERDFAVEAAMGCGASKFGSTLYVMSRASDRRGPRKRFAFAWAPRAGRNGDCGRPPADGCGVRRRRACATRHPTSSGGERAPAIRTRKGAITAKKRARQFTAAFKSKGRPIA
jgi:hypothetical protein